MIRFAVKIAACRQRVLPLVTALVALSFAAAPLPAEAAGTAGNTIVRNTITVNYSDVKGANPASATSSVDVTVNTVSATPSIVPPLPTSGTTDGAGASMTYTFRIRTNSSGPRAVSLAALYNPLSDSSSTTNMSAFGSAPTVSAPSIFLGATMIDPSDSNGTIASWPAGGSVTFKVPNDGGVPSDSAESGGSVGDGVVNGLKNGDMVYLYGGGNNYYGPFSVGTVSELPPGSGTSPAADSIQLVNNLGAGALSGLATGYGWQILEAKDITVTVTEGTVANPTLAAKWTTTLTATMSGAAALTTTVVTNALLGEIAISKFVRNASAAVVGASPYPPVTVNGTTYGAATGNAFYASGVSGKPGDNLEYLTVVSNIGTGSSTVVFASDAIPSYSSLITWGAGYGAGTASTGTAGVFAHAKLNLNETDMATGGTGAAAVGFGGLNTAGTSLTFDLGSGSAWGTGGTLASGQSIYLIYQQRVN